MPITINGDEPDESGKRTEEEEKAKPNQASPKDGPSDSKPPEATSPLKSPPMEEGTESEPLEMLPSPEDCSLPKRPDDGYDVGYRKPPKEHQFQKGRSGNPRGRPKHSKNRKTIARAELRKTVRVKTSKGMATMSTAEVIIKRIFEDAMRGDHRAQQAALKMMDELDLDTTLETQDSNDAARRRRVYDRNNVSAEAIELSKDIFRTWAASYRRLENKLGRKPTGEEMKEAWSIKPLRR